MAKASGKGQREWEPGNSHNFVIAIDGIILTGFTSVNFPTAELAFDSPETQATTKKSSVKFGSLKLKRHHDSADVLATWIKKSANTASGATRKSIGVTLRNNDMTDIMNWAMHEAWIKSHKISSFDASKSEALTEEIEIVAEKIERA